MTPEDAPATLPLPTTRSRAGKAGEWFFTLTLAGLGLIILCLTVSVLVLFRSLDHVATLERDWQSEAVQQQKVKLARQFEARQLTENLLRLREFSRTLDKIGAE